ncbi:MAG: response regulator [Candidatus Latescibacterota bacterium]|jgi:CheY-like chemotaxis protein
MKHILVVDDDESIRNLLRTILEREGYAVTSAADGKEATRMFRRNQPDLIITDIIMPEQEGLRTISNLRKEHPDIGIIAISGGGQYGLGEYLDVATALGADQTFAKPFERLELVKAVRKLLFHKRPPAV